MFFATPAQSCYKCIQMQLKTIQQKHFKLIKNKHFSHLDELLCVVVLRLELWAILISLEKTYNPPFFYKKTLCN